MGMHISLLSLSLLFFLFYEALSSFIFTSSNIWTLMESGLWEHYTLEIIRTISTFTGMVTNQLTKHVKDTMIFFVCATTMELEEL